MRILEKQNALLSNEEVLHHIQKINAENIKNPDFSSTKLERKADGSQFEKPTGRLRDLRTICDDFISFFSASESALSSEAKRTLEPSENDVGVLVENSEEKEAAVRFVDLAKRLKPYRLTMAECLMIVNHRPRDESVLEVLIEEVDSRFTTEQQAEILKIVAETYNTDDD